MVERRERDDAGEDRLEVFFDAAHTPTLRAARHNGRVTVPENQDDPVVRAKAALRAEARARRRARSPEDRVAVDSSLAVRLGGIPEVAALVASPSVGCLAAYVSYGTEPGTSAIRGLLRLSGVRVLLPVIREDGGLDWAWDTGDVGPGAVAAGIPEPTSVVAGTGASGLVRLGCRVVLVPALAVDHQGRRMGKGGGFYDRILAELGPDRPLLVAVVHADDIVEEVPALPHDIPVDAILTSAGYVDLR